MGAWRFCPVHQALRIFLDRRKMRLRQFTTLLGILALGLFGPLQGQNINTWPPGTVVALQPGFIDQLFPRSVFNPFVRMEDYLPKLQSALQGQDILIVEYSYYEQFSSAWWRMIQIKDSTVVNVLVHQPNGKAMAVNALAKRKRIRDLANALRRSAGGFDNLLVVSGGGGGSHHAGSSALLVIDQKGIRFGFFKLETGIYPGDEEDLRGNEAAVRFVHDYFALQYRLF
jgi:hypothetical protein